MNPTTTGYYLFSGTRFVCNNQFRRVHEPVKIVEVWNRRGYELAVRMIGRQQAVPLHAFVAEWEPLDIGPVAVEMEAAP
jgi:hypothetical protein